MTDETLRFAPHGASYAECAVCLDVTLRRIVSGDGHVPICSRSCLRTWPRVRVLLVERDEARAEAARYRDCYCDVSDHFGYSEPGVLPWEEASDG